MSTVAEHNATILVYGERNNKDVRPHITQHKSKLSYYDQRIAQKRINAYYAKLVSERDRANSDLSGSMHLRGHSNATLREAAYLYMTGYLASDWHG